MLPRLLSALSLLVLSLALTACADAQAPADPSHEASASPVTPLFASEEEATQAADALIKEYWAATNTVFKAGGQGVEILEPLVTERRMEPEIRGAAAFHDQGFTQIGDHTTSDTTFQQIAEEDGFLQLYVTTCVDYSGVRAVTADGTEAVRKNAIDRYLHQVTIYATGEPDSPELRLDMTEPWPDSPC